MDQERDQNISENRENVAEDSGDSIDRELDAAMAELDAAIGKLPKAAIELLREHRDLAVPRLIEAVRSAAAGAREGDLPEGNAHFLALFLLTEFRATEALPAILEAVCLPGELPFDLFGDTITETLARILPVLADDPPEVLDALIANEELNEYVRWEGAQSYIILVRDGRISRAEAVARLADHLRILIDRDDAPVAGYLVNVLVSLAPREARELIDEAYDRGLVGPWITGRKQMEQSILEGDVWVQKELDRCPATGIDDTIAELETWAAFSEKPPPARESAEPMANIAQAPTPAWSEPTTTPTPAPQLPGRKTGRNEPCPCGSGKKYKKCCGRNS